MYPCPLCHVRSICLVLIRRFEIGCLLLVVEVTDKGSYSYRYRWIQFLIIVPLDPP